MRIRPAEARDAAALGRVHVAVWRQAYAGLMPADYLASLSAEEREARWTKVIGPDGPPGSRAFVATDAEDGIVGFAMAGRARTKDVPCDAELWSIHIDAAHHRQVVGRALMLTAARWLLGEGHRSMMLWVIETNRARGFYDRLGGKAESATRDASIGGAALREIAYSWPLADFVRRLESEARRRPS